MYYSYASARNQGSSWMRLRGERHAAATKVLATNRGFDLSLRLIFLGLFSEANNNDVVKIHSGFRQRKCGRVGGWQKQHNNISYLRLCRSPAQLHPCFPERKMQIWLHIGSSNFTSMSRILDGMIRTNTDLQGKSHKLSETLWMADHKHLNI